MPAAETIAGLAGFERRGAGTDAERRAAVWLAGQLRSPRRTAELETFWCRPAWAGAHAWHAALAIAGSLVSVASAPAGTAIVLVALLSITTDALLGVSPGRLLTFRRASQNVVSRSSSAAAGTTRLLVTAAYDSPRAGAATRLPTSSGRAPGWLAWLALACVWLLVTGGLRASGASGTAIGIVQLIPTAALVVAFALLLDMATAAFDPSPDSASGAAVAIALARALDVAPPRRLSVEVVLQGAGAGQMLGLRRHLRAHRPQLPRRGTIVLGIAPAAGGGAQTPSCWVSDGPLIPVRYDPRLIALAARAGGQPVRRRGTAPPLPARYARLPALAIGGGEPDRLLAFALQLVDAIDVELASPSGLSGRPASSPAAGSR